MSVAALRYRACGLEIDSEIALRHVPAGDAGRAADLRIRHCSTLASLDASISTPQWRLASGVVHLFGTAGADCQCIDGREIAFRGTGPILDETSTLLGRALAVICWQRGLPVFHAAVVERAGQAFAIAGRSGAGKSTLTMTLLRRGFRVVADDIAVCHLEEEKVVAQPLYPVTRRQATGPATAGWTGIPGTQKQVSTDVPFCSEPRALDRMFVIEVSAGDKLQMRDITPADAARQIEAHCYRKGLARALLGFEGLRQVTTEAAAIMPVTLVTRPPDCSPAILADALLRRLDRG